MTDEEAKVQADAWIESPHYYTEKEDPIVWQVYGCNVDQIPGISYTTDDSGDWWTGVLPAGGEA